MKLRKDGSPISSNSIANKGASKDSLSVQDIKQLLKMSKQANEVHLATIREVYYVDDVKNQSKSQVEYRVRIEFGERHGQEYESVTALNLYGGIVNISETVYTPKDQIIKGNRNAEDTYMFDHDASQVLVAFMDGYPNRPFIIGGWNHTNNDVFATKRASGVRKIEEFNGLRIETNKDGEFILTYYGGPRNTKTKKAARTETAPTTFRIDQTGAWSVSDKEKQEIKIDRVSKKVTLTQYSGTKADENYGESEAPVSGEVVNQIEMDKDGKKVTLKSGNTTTVVDGNSNKVTITCGATIIIVDGSSGKISLTGNMVDVGDGASALAVLGPQLISWLTNHTHMGDGPSIPPAPTSPPIVPPPSSLLSTTVKIKS